LYRGEEVLERGVVAPHGMRARRFLILWPLFSVN
jgi:hypothetical protein